MEKTSYDYANFKASDLKLPEETNLVRRIGELPEIVKNATEHYKPNHIANYMFSLAKVFNDFYHATKVIGSKEENSRLVLIDATRIALKNSASLLGIEMPEVM